MSTATKSKPRAPKLRDLVEQRSVGADARTPLKIDEERGIIFRVKVLGRFSKNNHGLTEAENGSDYAPCMRGAIGEYEAKKVKCNHPANRAEPGKERPVEDTFGVLRNVVLENDESGEPALWADLHYLQSHPMAPRVIEDVKKGLGVYGLSHNAAAKRERFDRAARRLVIEELAIVRSVDLVDKPATNRNLWESERRSDRAMPKTTRELLESRLAKLSKPRRKWANVLLEDDAMAPVMDAPAEAPEGGDEDDALWSGFQAAIQKVLDSYKAGECDAKGAGKKIADWIKAHDKLAGADEPEPPKKDVEESDDDDEDKGKKDKVESEELVTLRREKAARELCESIGFVPTALQIEAVAGIKDAKRQRELAESYKPDPKSGGGFKAPKSAAPGAIKAPAGKTGGSGARETQESEVVPAADALRTLMGD